MRILSLGAGVQSTTVLLKSMRGGFPPIDHAIFADTGYEPRTTIECVERLVVECEKHGVPLHVVRYEGSREFRRQIPAFVKNSDGSKGMSGRQCTVNFKIEPIRLKIRELLGVAPRRRVPAGTRVEIVMGIGWDELQRMKPAREPWMVNVYPLIDIRWGRVQCLEWLRDNWPFPVSRSACWNCPFRSTKEWRSLHSNDYLSWVKAVKFDDELRRDPPSGLDGEAYLHSSLKPLRAGRPSLRRREGAGRLVFERVRRDVRSMKIAREGK